MKERFIDLLLRSGRENIEDLIRYLDEQTDFFSAPASTRFHGACEAGLLEHSLAVYDNLCRLAAAYALPFSAAEVTICALLHDVCKTNFYKRGSRNRKNPVTGAWEQVPVYEIEDLLPLGHEYHHSKAGDPFVNIVALVLWALAWYNPFMISAFSRPGTEWSICTCTSCGACTKQCYSGARELVGRTASVEEVLAEVLKDRIFYENSGGGMRIRFRDRGRET